MQVSRYYINAKLNINIAVVADAHGEISDEVISTLVKENPDFIVSPGDLFDRHPLMDQRHDEFVNEMCRRCVKLINIAPLYMSLGNHERHLFDEDYKKIKSVGVHILDNEYIDLGKFALAGFSSNVDCGASYRRREKLNLKFLYKFEELDKYKILLSHHPEYYYKYIHDKDIDLVISGHAHGGQIRIFGKGLFAPGQGIFPKYTSGKVDRMIISRGLNNTTKIPRIFNDYELVMIHL